MARLAELLPGEPLEHGSRARWFIRALSVSARSTSRNRISDREHRDAEDPVAVAALEGEGREQRVEELGAGDDRRARAPRSQQDQHVDVAQRARRQIAKPRSAGRRRRARPARIAVSSGGKNAGEITGTVKSGARIGATASVGRGHRRCAAVGATLPRLMRILILGGDGYLGWPTAMRFSAPRPRGLRRRQLLPPPLARPSTSTDSLTPIGSLDDRIDAWQEVSGKEIRSYVGSIEDAEFLERVIAETDAGGGHPLRRAALGAVLDEVARARRSRRSTRT